MSPTIKKGRKPENKVKAEIKKICDRLGIFNRAYVASAYEKGGFPDRLLCVPLLNWGIGLFVTIEAKTTGNKPTALQTEVMQDIRACGGVTLVIDESNIGQLEIWLNWLMHLSTAAMLHTQLPIIQNDSPVGYSQSIEPFVV